MQRYHLAVSVSVCHGYNFKLSFPILQGEQEGAAAMVPSDDEGEMEDMKARLEALRS